MTQSADRMSLWTVWCDYEATGEGRSTMACIAYASSEEQMRTHFSEKFGDWFGKGCEVQMGVVRNRVTQYLWSGAILDAIERCEHQASVDAHAWVHVNFS